MNKSNLEYTINYIFKHNRLENYNFDRNDENPFIEFLEHRVPFTLPFSLFMFLVFTVINLSLFLLLTPDANNQPISEGFSRYGIYIYPIWMGFVINGFLLHNNIYKRNLNLYEELHQEKINDVFPKSKYNETRLLKVIREVNQERNKADISKEEMNYKKVLKLIKKRYKQKVKENKKLIKEIC